MFCISSAVAWGWGSCGFHGLDEFTEVRILRNWWVIDVDEACGDVGNMLW